MAELLASEKRIAVSGTVENQVSFCDRFEHVVLLSAPVEVLLERLHSRADNPYGRSPRDREEGGSSRHSSLVESESEVAANYCGFPASSAISSGNLHG